MNINAVYVTEKLDWKARFSACSPPLPRRAPIHPANEKATFPVEPCRFRPLPPLSTPPSAPLNHPQLAAFDLLSEWSEQRAPEALQSGCFMLEEQFKPDEVRKGNWAAIQSAPAWCAAESGKSFIRCISAFSRSFAFPCPS